MATLLDYFDEAETTCNQCDICKKKSNEAIHHTAMLEGRHYVMNAIRNGKQDLKNIIETVDYDKEKELLHIIRAMLDAKEIYYQKPGELEINEPSKPLHG